MNFFFNFLKESLALVKTQRCFDESTYRKGKCGSSREEWGGSKRGLRKGEDKRGEEG